MEDIAHDASSPASPKPVDMAAQQASRPDTPDKGKLRVFISYSRDDLHFADQLDAALEMSKAARTDVFARDTQEIERGAGLLQAPPPVISQRTVWSKN